MVEGRLHPVDGSPLAHLRAGRFGEGADSVAAAESVLGVASPRWRQVAVMRPFERKIIEILNCCPDLTAPQLQRKLSILLLGVNRCRSVGVSGCVLSAKRPC